MGMFEDGYTETPQTTEVVTLEQEDYFGSIERSYMLTLEQAREATGRAELVERDLAWQPQGQRVLVVGNPPQESYGGLIALPESAVAGQLAGAGIVIGVGPMAGQVSNAGYAGNVMCPGNPSILLGKHVMFGHAAGKQIKSNLRDVDYNSMLIMLTVFDIWGIDVNPNGFYLDLAQDLDYKKQRAALVTRAEAEEAAAAERMREERAAQAVGTTPGPDNESRITLAK